MTTEQPVILKEARIPVLQGKPFYDTSVPKALAQAQKYAGKKGFVATMPHLLLNFPHSEWYTANSEDISGIDTDGVLGVKGQAVVLTYHGGGILAGHPKRIQKAYADKLNAVYAAVLSPKEFTKALKGEVLAKGKAPVYKYEEFLEESVSSTFLEDHPVYATARPLEDAKKQPSGSGQNIKDLVNHTQVIVYAGGKQRAAEAMERAAKVYTDGKLGVWHQFGASGFDAAQSQARVLFLYDSPFNGLVGDDSLYGARFVGVVAAEPHSGLRAARAEKICRSTLEQVLRLGQEHISPAGRKAFEQAARQLYR